MQLILRHYSLDTQLSKYAMTAAHEVSVTREPIGIAEKQHYFSISFLEVN